MQISLSENEFSPTCDFCKREQLGMYYCTGNEPANKNCHFKQQYYCLKCKQVEKRIRPHNHEDSQSSCLIEREMKKWEELHSKASQVYSAAKQRYAQHEFLIKYLESFQKEKEEIKESEGHQLSAKLAQLTTILTNIEKTCDETIKMLQKRKQL